MNIAEFGETSTYTNNNGKINSMKLKWDKKYNGKIVDIDINVDNNDKKQHYTYKIPHTDLPKLIQSPILLDMFLIEQNSKQIIQTLQNIKKTKLRKSRKTLKKNNKKLVIF